MQLNVYFLTVHYWLDACSLECVAMQTLVCSWLHAYVGMLMPACMRSSTFIIQCETGFIFLGFPLSLRYGGGHHAHLEQPVGTF